MWSSTGVFLLVVGCGSGTVDVAGDAGASDGATVDTTTLDTGSPVPDADPSACNAVVNIGAPQVEVRVAAPLPTLAGAAEIPSGTYVLVKNELYTGTGGSAGPGRKTLRETLVFSSGVVQQAIAQDTGPDWKATSTYSIVGSRILVDSTCGPGAGVTSDASFDVFGSTLRIAVTGVTDSPLLTFERR